MTREPDARSDASARSAGNEQRRPWRNQKVVLGVSGGIAAYKSVQLARDLTQLGAAVDVILTRSASEFVGAVTFEALTGRQVYTQLVAAGSALDHIRLAREADVVCVAPATATATIFWPLPLLSSRICRFDARQPHRVRGHGGRHPGVTSHNYETLLHGVRT